MCKKFNYLLSQEPRPFPEISQLGTEIDTFMEKHLDGIKKRAKVQQLNCEEGTTSDLFKREKKRGIRKTMTELRTDSGEVLTSKPEMLNLVSVVVVNYCFTSLFGTKGLLSDIVIR